jgi:DegV family protein with EDD domain
MINILTDSCADLSQPLLEAHAIRMIPLHVLVSDKDFYDNQISLEELYQSVNETSELPKTAAPSVQEFMEFFDLEGPSIYIGLSSKLSATMQNATLAAQQIKKPDLFLLDSLNLSTGIGLLALKAADLRDAGKSLNDILQEIDTTRSKVKTSFVIDTMEYLHKGGRCTGLQAFVGSLLKIRPIIHVQADGTLAVLDKVRGSRKKALDVLLSKFEADLPNMDLTRIFVTHSGCVEDAAYLAKEIKNLRIVADVNITMAGATIASHCGPDTIGILYIIK